LLFLIFSIFSTLALRLFSTTLLGAAGFVAAASGPWLEITLKREMCSVLLLISSHLNSSVAMLRAPLPNRGAAPINPL
jgi:hypothetical protein